MTKAVTAKKDAFDRFKSLDKQDINTVSAAGVALGAGICAYYLGRVSSKVIRNPGGLIANKLSLTMSSFNIGKAIPTFGIVNRVTEAISTLMSTNKAALSNYNITQETIRQTEENRDKAPETSRPAFDAVLNTLKATETKQRRVLEDFFENYQGLVVGQAILVGFLSMWLLNNPDVVKQLVSSTEKIAVRGIDELSEVIDKTGEAIQDAAEGLLPDLWGLGW